MIIEKGNSYINPKKSIRFKIFITCFVFLFLVIACILLIVMIPKVKYNNAIKLMDDGKYNEAISAFEENNEYKDSEIKIEECKKAIIDNKYNNTLELMTKEMYTEAISAFEELDGYKDSKLKIEECKNAIIEKNYMKALMLMNEGKIQDAHDVFIQLGDYKDSILKIEFINEIKQLNNVIMGDYIKFGKYEQDNNFSNGKEKIEWLVTDKKDGKILLVSKYLLDYKKYNSSYIETTWESCTLRKWLNNDFYTIAFSADEQSLISKEKASADHNPEHETNPGNTTQDNIFLLSGLEAKKYFGSDDARKCSPTEYAAAVTNGMWKISSGPCWWWLRTPGRTQSDASLVATNGIVDYMGDYVISRAPIGVRPALWIDLNDNTK